MAHLAACLSASSQEILHELETTRRHTKPNVVTLDQQLDNEADSPRLTNVIRGHEYMTKGKWGHKKTFAEIYREDKSYLQWVRRHVDGTSHHALRALKAYVEMRDHSKSERIQREQSGQYPITPIRPKSKAPVPAAQSRLIHGPDFSRRRRTLHEIDAMETEVNEDALVHWIHLTGAVLDQQDMKCRAHMERAYEAMQDAHRGYHLAKMVARLTTPNRVYTESMEW